MSTDHSAPLVLPDDEYNRQLVENVHPPDWINPRPQGKYDLVVLGGGTAGLVTAAGAAGLGAKVALVERHLLGGDCLNVGCVPSKALLSAARKASTICNSTQYGVHAAGDVHVDFAQVMQRMRRLRTRISPHDSAARFRGLGVDVFLGQARFGTSETVEVAGEKLHYKKAVICTGGRASVPVVPGLREAGYLTNENLFTLTELPARLAVVGGGPIGCEMAQAFARFGARATLIHSADRLLPRDDEQASHVLAQSLHNDGIELRLNSRLERVEPTPAGKLLQVRGDQGLAEFEVDEILIAVGRTPNVEGLNLEGVGVEYDHTGVKVDDRLRTTNRRIFAAGDICFPHKFTHAADFLARIVIQNSLFFGRASTERLLIPRCTYTSPEVAHVGLTPQLAAEQGIEIQTFTQELSAIDRAILDGEDEGFVKVHVRQGTDRIVGATVVAGHAGDLISELTLAMQHRIGLRQIAATIHPYPTQAEAIRKLGDQYNRTRLTPFSKRLLKFLISLGR